MKRLIFIIVCFVFTKHYGQTNYSSITAKFIESSIVLDGHLNEDFWKDAEVAADFWQFFPTDTTKTAYPTEVKIAYDDNHLYIGINAAAENGNYVVTSLKRDFPGTSNDNISLLFDTFNDGTTAYFFGVTPYGVQREGLVSEGGGSFNNSWDMKWQTEAQRFDDHFTIEVAIPFTSLKFAEGGDRWRFRAYRWNVQSNEQSSWVKVPQNQLLSSLAYMGELVFEKPLGKSKTPLALISYVNTTLDKDYTTDTGEHIINVGGDAKIAIGNSMNLDVTVNPDFSNVEVDDIFTNLTRFELFLPEKRQFFIDNSDLFANYGSTLDNIPFFSRRIGLARNAEGQLIENRILGGVRLSGKLNPEWRMGFLNIQTARDEANEIPSNNNTMLAFQKKMFSRSNLGFFMVNRQAFGDDAYISANEKYNRVVGIDYDLASPDNVWRGNFYVHKSFQPDDSKGNLAAQSILYYDDRLWRFAADFVYVDEDYQADLGFVPRKDVFKTGQSATRRFYPKKGTISSHSLGALAVNFWRPNQNYRHTDYTYRLSYDIAFTNQATFGVQLLNNYIYLTNSFDPTRTEGALPLPGEMGYTFSQANAEYVSNPSKLFSYTASASAGEFFNGHQYSIGGQLNYRWQPWANFSVAVNYDKILLPDPYPSADLWLVSPRAEVTFSKSLFWSTLVQYSNQRDNIGVNSRLQWRFAPLSDLFFVYNDNYFSNQFAPKFRSVSLKLTYWLNI